MRKYPKKLTKTGKTIWDIYRDLYRQSEPSVDFDELYMTSPKEKDTFGIERTMIPYNDYYLEDSAYNNIVDRHLSRNKWKLTENELLSVRVEAYLGCGPTSTKQNETS